MVGLYHRFAESAQRLIRGNKPRVVVGVSGGADSLALAILLARFVREAAGELVAVTVDHGLRTESRHEAETAARIMRQRGIEHHLVSWQGEKPVTHIQERARQARYALLMGVCRDFSAGYLATAHQAEDQAETFWMRLAHGSGLDGLSGMMPLVQKDGLALIRPLLPFRKQELQEFCRAEGVMWVDDPSNTNQKFLRPRLRSFEDMLNQEGLSAERLALVMQKLQLSKDALQWMADRAIKEIITLGDAGFVTLSFKSYQSWPQDIRLRVLQKAFDVFDPSGYAVPFAQVQSLDQHIMSGTAAQTVTGVEVFTEGESVLFCREAAVVQEPVILGPQPTIWDRRFVVSGMTAEGYQLGALGADGLAALKQQDDTPPELWSLPHKIRLTLPAIRRDGKIISLPSLYWGQKSVATELLTKHLFS